MSLRRFPQWIWHHSWSILAQFCSHSVTKTLCRKQLWVGLKRREKMQLLYEAAMLHGTALWWKLWLWRAAPSASLWSSVCGSSGGRWPRCRPCGCCCGKLYFLWKQLSFSVLNDLWRSSEQLINTTPILRLSIYCCFYCKDWWLLLMYQNISSGAVGFLKAPTI